MAYLKIKKIFKVLILYKQIFLFNGNLMHKKRHKILVTGAHSGFGIFESKI